jgi:hypothetical protein
MKQLLITILIVLFFLPVYSQDMEPFSARKNELNLGYFNMFELNGLGDLGIGYKRIGEKGAFRTALGMNFGKSESETETYQDNSKYYEFSPRIGYEFHHWYNRIRLNYGGDIFTSISKSSFEDVYDDPSDNRTSIYNTYQYGIRPTLGITVYLSKSISVSTETYMDISFTQRTEERTYNGSTNTYESKGMNVGLGPLGIVSINLHF